MDISVLNCSYLVPTCKFFPVETGSFRLLHLTAIYWQNNYMNWFNHQPIEALSDWVGKVNNENSKIHKLTFDSAYFPVI
jgi:hypothetical protein